MNNKSNKEWYQDSFNNLHLSDDFRERLEASTEDGRKGNIMNIRSIYGISRAAAAIVAACAVVLGSAGVCYACDAGGIRTRFNMWINGNKEIVEVENLDDNSVKLTVIGKEGNVTSEMNAGGLVIDEDGNQAAMSAQDLVNNMNNNIFLEEVDGRFIFTYKNITADVTDNIDDKGNLYVHLTDPNNDYTYFDVTEIRNGGYSVSAGPKPSFGKDYLELDSSSLDTDGSAPTDLDDNTAISFTTTTEE